MARAAALSVVTVMMTGMAITMENWVLTWTDAEGRARGSAVGYDAKSAADEKARLEVAGCTAVVVEKTKPGVLPVVGV